MAKHKWHKEIKAWADGAEIEHSYYTENGVDIWNVVDDPRWSIYEADKYRIKPTPKEPKYLYVYGKADTNIFFSVIQNMGFKNYIGKIKLETEDE
jgi:hypothetical protein